jgi:hypothetical protein
MTWNLWLPFWIGICLLLLALPVIFLLPASKPSPAIAQQPHFEHEPLLQRSSGDAKLPQTETLFGRCGRPVFDACHQLWSQLIGRPNFRLLVAIFLVASLASCNTPILPQYISKRYGWTFAEAGYLLSVKAAVNIVLLTAVVPTVISILLKRPQFNGVRINLYGAERSLALSVVGAIFVATSVKMWMLVCCRFSSFYKLYFSNMLQLSFFMLLAPHCRFLPCLWSKANQLQEKILMPMLKTTPL